MLDILIAIGLLVGLVRGFTTGAIRQIMGLAGVVLSIVLALELMAPAGNVIGSLLGLGREVALVVGFILAFVIGQLVLRMLTRVIENSLKALRLGILNRLGGAAFGVCKAALLMSVLFLALGLLRAPAPQRLEASVLYGPVSSVFPAAWDYAARLFPAVRELSDRFGREMRGATEEIEDDVSPEDPALETEPPANEAPADSMGAGVSGEVAGESESASAGE